MRNLVILLLLLTVLPCCKKPQNVQPTYISADFKSYFDYQPGTYWLFYDSVNNYFDSVVVATYTDQQVTTAQTSNEEVQIAMLGYYQGAMGSTSSWSMFLAQNTCSISFGASGYYEPTGDELAKDMPFRTGSYSFSNNVTHQPVTWNTVLLPNYTLGTATFKNVYMITNALDNGAYATDTFYINADNGFIAIMRHNSYSSPARLFLTAEHIIH